MLTPIYFGSLNVSTFRKFRHILNFRKFIFWQICPSLLQLIVDRPLIRYTLFKVFDFYFIVDLASATAHEAPWSHGRSEIDTWEHSRGFPAYASCCLFFIWLWIIGNITIKGTFDLKGILHMVQQLYSGCLQKPL